MIATILPVSPIFWIIITVCVVAIVLTFVVPTCRAPRAERPPSAKKPDAAAVAPAAYPLPTTKTYDLPPATPIISPAVGFTVSRDPIDEPFTTDAKLDGDAPAKKIAKPRQRNPKKRKR